MEYKHTNAFTVIEIMIVVTIIMSLSVFSVMIYSRNIREQRFEYEVSRYMDLLNYARQNALLNNTEGFQCPEYFGHKITMNSLQSYSLQICCFEACDCDPVSDPICQVRNIQDYSMHDSVTFDGTQHVRFRESAGGTGEPSDIQVQIKSTTLNTCVDINISTTGLIERGTSYDCP